MLFDFHYKLHQTLKILIYLKHSKNFEILLPSCKKSMTFMKEKEGKLLQKK